RFLFTPSLGFCFALGMVVSFLDRRQVNVSSSGGTRWVLSVTLVFCLLLGIRTIIRAEEWKNNLTILTADLESSPNSARERSALAVTYLKLAKDLPGGDQQKEYLHRATINFRRSLEILPSQWPAWHDLGRISYLAGEYDEALRNYQRALECDPDSALVYSSLAQTYLRMGQNLQGGDQQKELFRKAIAHYRKSLDINPAQWDAWHDIGCASYYAGDYDEAMKSFQRSLQCDPNRSSTYVNIGAIAFARKQYERAIEMYRIAEKLDNSNADACANLGVVYQQMGDMKNAITEYEKALRLNPYRESVRRSLELLKSASTPTR
ncbi:MAG TPA: tetratricopeptide repeat protein, partial [Bacteroidota bacterium]|nr:tetratricopeptide repeat protein [Bacteroidota bacterium]